MTVVQYWAVSVPRCVCKCHIHGKAHTGVATCYNLVIYCLTGMTLKIWGTCYLSLLKHSYSSRDTGISCTICRGQMQLIEPIFCGCKRALLQRSRYLSTLWISSLIVQWHFTNSQLIVPSERLHFMSFLTSKSFSETLQIRWRPSELADTFDFWLIKKCFQN